MRAAQQPHALVGAEHARVASLMLQNGSPQVDGTRPVVLKSPKEHLRNSKPVSLSRNHELVTQDNPQTNSFMQELCALFLSFFLSNEKI